MCTWYLLAELQMNKSLENTLRHIILSVVAVVIIFVKFYVVLATLGNEMHAFIHSKILFSLSLYMRFVDCSHSN